MKFKKSLPMILGFGFAISLVLTWPLSAKMLLENDIVKQEDMVIQAELKEKAEAVGEFGIETDANIEEIPDETLSSLKLYSINQQPLGPADFSVKTISFGSTAHDLTGVFGLPKKILHGNLSDEYQYEDLYITFRHGLPYDEKTAEELGIETARMQKGVREIYFESSNYKTARGLTIGDSRENIVRLYGIPAGIFYNPQELTTLYVYADKKQKNMLVFTVQDLNIISVRIKAADELLLNKTAQKMKPGKMEVDDFTLMGFKLGRTYKEPVWDFWEKKMENSIIEYWYFANYVVRFLKDDKKIDMVFLQTPQVTTTRGLAIGDSLTTLFALYGEPQILETGETGYPDVYYYVNPAEESSYFAVFINKEKSIIEDIILTRWHIDKTKSSSERYGLV